MPATSGTLEYVKTRVASVVELRGVPTAGLSTGDVAYVGGIPNVGLYYVLVKDAVNPDNNGTVIATKEALAATAQIQGSGLPLTPPGLPVTPASTQGRWFQSNIATLVVPV